MGKQLEVGDLVRLKSSGPLMTVSQNDGTEVHCRWFAAEGGEVAGKVYEAYFKPAMLMPETTSR